MAQRKRTGSETNFESSLQKLEAIVKRLEEEEIPLEVSLKLFAEGQTLARACEEQLKAAENQIKLLLEKPSGKLDEVDFEPADSSPVEPPSNADATAVEEEDEDEDEEEDDAKKESDPAPARDTQGRSGARGHGDPQGHAPDRVNPKKAAPGSTPDLDELPF